MNGRKFVNGTTGVQLHPDRLDQPLKWKRPRRIFVNSLSDLFHEDVPDEFIDRVFAVMGLVHQHTFQVLTKRPERMRTYMATRARHEPVIDAMNEIGRVDAVALRWPLPNVWLGVSVENQETADERIPLLLQTPAAKRFISAEPLLGPIDLTMGLEPFHALDPMLNRNPSPLDWVIVGGESGPAARPCDVAWIRSIKDQCKAAGVPVFIKQLGGYVVDRNDAGFEGDEPTAWPMDTDVDDPENEWSYQGARIRIRLQDRKGGDMSEWPEDLRIREFPTKGARDE